MGPRLDYGQQEGFDLGTDPLGATGCFAIGGVRLGGGIGAVRACQCGARNSSGQWAPTDSADGYEYMLHAGPSWAAPRTDRHQTPSTRGGRRVAPFHHCDDFKLRHYHISGVVELRQNIDSSLTRSNEGYRGGSVEINHDGRTRQRIGDCRAER